MVAAAMAAAARFKVGEASGCCSLYLLKKWQKNAHETRSAIFITTVPDFLLR